MPIHSAVIQKLLSTNAHIGRRITAAHLKPYLHGTRNSLSIVDSEKTLISLRTALDFISHLIRAPSSSTRPAKFLFINTNPLYDDIFDHMTRLTGFGSFLNPQSQYWRRTGFLTNPHSPKLFRGRGKRLCFAPVDPPDCIVVVDPEMKCSAINEASRVGVPVVALVDSDTPLEVYEKIAYPIVCGGESVQFVYMLCNLITKTFLLEKKLSSVSGFEDFAVDADVNGADVSGANAKAKAKANANSDSESDSDSDVDANVNGVFDDGRSGVNANASVDVDGEQTILEDTNEITEEMKIVPDSA